MTTIFSDTLTIIKYLFDFKKAESIKTYWTFLLSTFLIIWLNKYRFREILPGKLISKKMSINIILFGIIILFYFQSLKWNYSKIDIMPLKRVALNEIALVEKVISKINFYSNYLDYTALYCF